MLYSEHLPRVFPQELRPHLVLQRHVLHVGHDAFEAEPHREIARVDHLVRAAGVGVSGVSGGKSARIAKG